MSSNSVDKILGGDTQFLASLLSGISVTSGSDDARHEVIERYLWKLERSEQRRRILDALEFLRALHGISGSPPAVFVALRELLDRYDLDPEPLTELEQLVAVIGHSGVTNQQIVLNLALGRGVSYYTGLVFEIHALDEDGSEIQLCGGGRYDHLLRAVGGTRDVNACGFAFGVERLLSLVPQSYLPTVAITQALVIPVSSKNMIYALRVSRTARKAGLQVEVDVTGHGIGSGLKLATKKQIRLALIVGEDEQQTNKVTLHDLVTGEELVLDIDSLANHILGEEQTV